MIARQLRKNPALFKAPIILVSSNLKQTFVTPSIFSCPNNSNNVVVIQSIYQMDKLKNKVAVITGGTSGIGLATAKLFIKNGSKVVVFGRGQEALDRTKNELGANCLCIQGDISNAKDLENLFSETKYHFGMIDVLYINAAQIKLAAISETSENLFDEMININFKGSYFTLQKAIPFLNKKASVVFTTSYFNTIGFGGSSLLSASKAALRSLVRVAASELITNEIRVNAVSPGAIATPLWGKIGLPEDVLKNAAEEITNQIPMKRFGTPEEVAKTVLFLASEDSSYITGNELTVDGGLRQI
ncbi:MAG: SDR family oxidoreductase [Reichenbachiella sp.]